MKFVGKSIIEKEQLQSKKKFGVFDMEIQLYGKDFSNDIKDIYKEIIKVNINVVSIHAPLRTSKLDDFNLDIFIILEILEEDYILCPNFGKTLEAIKYVEQTFL